MDLLINELTLYSKIDTNRIPYNFTTLSVNEYFDDCAEDLKLELEQRDVEFGYFNYVEEDIDVYKRQNRGRFRAGLRLSIIFLISFTDTGSLLPHRRQHFFCFL